MEPLFHIPHQPDVPYYALLYATSFLLASGMVCIAGRKRGWPPSACVAIICGCVVGAIIGSKLLMIPLWGLTGVAHMAAATSGKTLLGGLLGGTVAVALVRRALGFRGSVADAFVWPVLLLVPLGRVGCLLAGCCFGRPLEAMWSITYGIGSLPFQAHVVEGLIPYGAAASLPVHPIPLYEIMFFLALTFVVWRWRRLPLAPGTRFYAVLLLYAGFRFVEEFFRHSALAESGLTPVQWMLIPLVALLGALILMRERQWSPSRAKYGFPVHWPQLPAAAITAALWGVLLLSFGWFSALELTVGALVLATGSIWLAMQALDAKLGQRLRVLPLSAVLVMPVGLALNDSAEILPDSLRSRYIEIGAGGMTTDYLGSVLIGHGGCDGDVPMYAQVPHEYRIGGLEAKYVAPQGTHSRTTIGARVYAGSDVRPEIRHNGRMLPEVSTQIFGFNPYVRLDGRWVGFAIGGHIGSLLIQPEFDDDNERFFMPMVATRLGPSDVLYADLSIGDGMPGGSPGMWWQAGAGAGIPLGEKQHLGLRVGTSQMGLYVNPILRIGDRTTFYSQFAPGDEEQRLISGGLLYRIPLR